MYLQNVVWERLDNVMGNTQFLKADFQPYGVTSLAEQVSDAADLMQAAFAGLPPSKSSPAQGAISPIVMLMNLLNYRSYCK